MRIGICDDQKEIREILTDKVKKYYPAEDIAVYSSGEELLAARKLPDILFLDVQMPEKDGMETARELRKRDRQMIIIFVTVTEDTRGRRSSTGR